MFDIVITGGRVVTSAGVDQIDLGIADGKIAALERLDGADASRTIDAGGRLVLPGLVDSHVHVRDPGYTYKEDFASCSAAAAAGGITTIMCMPNTDPVLDSPEAFRQTDAVARENCLIDYCLQGVATGRNLAAVAALQDLGVVTFEVFLAGPDALVTDDRTDQLAVFRAIAEAGGIAGVYPDEPAINVVIEALGAGEVADIGRAHPPMVETGALLPALTLAQIADCRVHFRQLSSALASLCADWIRRHVMPGRLTVEVTPHHLSLTEDDFRQAGPGGYVMPPLRTEADIESLWAALENGGIDTIGTDHAPHSWEEKIQGHGDLRKALPGFPGVETFLPVMLTEFARRGLSASDFVRFAAENPARIFGLHPRKGGLAAGSDADLAIIDDTVSWRIDPGRFFSKARYSPYGGREVNARVDLTMVRGGVVFEDGQIVEDTTHGILQTPQRTGG